MLHTSFCFCTLKNKTIIELYAWKQHKETPRVATFISN
jgi:hypothetical protein